MKCIDVRTDFPVSNAVTYCGNIFQAELNGIPEGETKAVPGGAAAETREIFSKLDRMLSELGVARTDVVSVKLYLQNLERDLAVIDPIYAEYFGSHCPTRGVYGVDLQPGLLVEAAVVANVPVYE